MPRAALENVKADAVVPVAAMGDVIAKMVRSNVERLATAPSTPVDVLDGEIAMAEFADVTTADLPVNPAGYGCPSCGGSLFEVTDQPVPRYRCRVGHAWSPQSLLDEQAVSMESALWMALRALEEKAALSRRMAENRQRRRSAAGYDYVAMADDAERATTLIRNLIRQLGASSAQDASIAPGLPAGEADG
jgi:two-component system chemotaxis response regulator CheB